MARFGPGDFWSLILHSGNVAGHLMRERHGSSSAYAERNAGYRKAQNIFRRADPELEAEICRDLEDPSKFNEMWEKLEAIRAEHRDKCLNSRYWSEISDMHWEPDDLNRTFAYTAFIEEGRKAFEGDTKKKALYVLMDRKGKCPLFCIEQCAEP